LMRTTYLFGSTSPYIGILLSITQHHFRASVEEDRAVDLSWPCLTDRSRRRGKMTPSGHAGLGSAVCLGSGSRE